MWCQPWLYNLMTQCSTRYKCQSGGSTFLGILHRALLRGPSAGSSTWFWIAVPGYSAIVHIHFLHICIQIYIYIFLRLHTYIYTHIYIYSVQHRAYSIRHAVCHIQYAVCSIFIYLHIRIQYAVYIIHCTWYMIQYVVCNIQYAVCSIVIYIYIYIHVYSICYLHLLPRIQYTLYRTHFHIHMLKDKGMIYLWIRCCFRASWDLWRCIRDTGIQSIMSSNDASYTIFFGVINHGNLRDPLMPPLKK